MCKLFIQLWTCLDFVPQNLPVKQGICFLVLRQSMHSPIFFDCYIRIVYTDIIVCMHACMHACMHGCMDVCMYVRSTYVRTWVSLYLSIYLSIYLCIVLYCIVFYLYCIVLYLYLYLCLYLYCIVCTYVRMYVCTYVCMYNIDLPLDTMHSKTSRRPVSTATACWGERPPRPHWPLHPAPPWRAATNCDGTVEAPQQREVICFSTIHR